MPYGMSRRGVLVALGLASAGVLSGCTLRLEADAPRLPLLARDPIPDESLLVAAWQSARSLLDEAGAVAGAAGAWPARLVPVHRAQLAVLEGILRRGEVPLPAATPAASPTTSAPAPTSTSPTPAGPATSGAPAPAPDPAVRTVTTLAAAEVAAVQAPGITALARASARNVALLGAIAAQRGAAAALLATPADWPAPTGPTGSTAGQVLARTRSAVYGFEVVAAQTSAANRPLAVSTLAALRRRAAALEALAGPAAATPPLGYALPFPVTDPAGARRLALRLLTSLQQDLAALFPSAARDEATLGGLVQWAAETAALAARWGQPLAAFPGLSTA